jgi:DNA-binding CsgD family transcriptional regulator
VPSSELLHSGSNVRSFGPGYESPSRQLRLNRLPPSSTPAFDGCVLSPCELQTVRLMARGLTYAEAARETRRTVSTVRTQLNNAYRRLGVSTISQALVTCTHAGWLDPVPDDGNAVELADRRVTWAQRLYLETFDQSLRAGDDPREHERTDQLRDAALTGMYKEADRERPWRQLTRDPIDRIAGTLAALDQPKPQSARRAA